MIADPGTRAKTPNRGRWRLLLEPLRRHRARIGLGVLLLFATNGLALSIPWIFKNTVDAVQRGEPAGTIARLAAAIVAVALLQALARTLSRIAILGASRHIVYELRNRFFERLITLPAPFLDRYRTGDLMSRAVNDLMLVRSFFGPGLMNLANTVLSWVGAVALMAAIDARLTLWSLLPYPFVLVAMNRLSRAMYLNSTLAQEQLAVVSSRAQENLAGVAQVRAYAMEDRELEAFDRLASDLRARNLKLARIRGAVVPLMGSVAGIGTLLVLWIGTHHLIDGTLTLGAFVAFNAYLASLAWPTLAMGWILNVFQRSIGAVERIGEILDATGPEADPPGGTEPLPSRPLVEVRDLTFSYAGSPSAALQGVSFRAEPGTVIGIVGPVGSGKTTLLRLLVDLYPAPAGSILLGGVELGRVDQDALRRAVAFVPQESFLFSMTLAENIALGRPEADREAIEDAARRAGLSDDLAELPRGLDTPVGERGYTLSGGQRQRAALARALLMQPDLLILDDPFASIDAGTEQEILGHLAAGGGPTRIIAGHRVSAVQAADEILVFEAGRIVERGRHENLLAAEGLYALMFERQRTEQEIETS